jgi:hypothetical protein
MTSFKFDVFSVILMALAIGLGSVVGNALANMIGFAGGIIGSMITGFVVYVIFAFLSGIPIRVIAGIIFAVMVWLANMLAGMVHGWTGFGGGIIGLFISAIILSFLWGNFGASMAGTPTTTSTKKTAGKKRS